MSAERYTKHLRSKYKRYVCTFSDGTRVSADTQKEFREKISAVVKKENPKSVSSVQPKYDPNTGELIN